MVFLFVGVAYIIDKVSQSCFANAIMNTSFDLQLNKTALRKDGAYLVQMKSPNSLFYLDNTYTYQGTVRT